MAQVANTFDTTQARGNREDLADRIEMITPEETPFYSMLDDRKVKAIKHEWQTDALATPSTNNARVEGDTYSYGAVTPTVRVGNYNQIMMKEFLVSETQEEVDHAGRKSERAYQKAKFGAELKTDIEATFLTNQASVAGTSVVPAKLGSLRAWLATNDFMGAGGSSGGYNTGTGVVDAATNGTQRTFTKAIMDDSLEGAYRSGGNPKVAIVSPYIKRVFSSFMADAATAQQRYEAPRKSATTIIGAADVYLSDWGPIDVVPNRQMARVGATLARNAYFIDPSKVGRGFLRRIREDKEVAKTSDGLPCVLKCEVTLVLDNEAAHAVAADLFGMTAST